MHKTIATFLLISAVMAGAAYAEGPPAVKVSLEESIRSALENNVDISVQRSKPVASAQDVQVAESAFDSALFGGVSYSKTMTPSTSALSSPSVGETSGSTASLGVKQKLMFGTSYSLTLDATQSNSNSTYAGINPQYTSNLALALTQPLLKGAGSDVNGAQVTIAKNTKGISDEDFANGVMNILTQTQETYWDLVYLGKQLAVQMESVERARDLKKQIELKVQVGVLAPIEVTAAEATVATREEELIATRQAIQNAEDNLKKLMNRKDTPLGSPVPVVPSDEAAYKEVVLNLEQLKTAAYENRPDYRQAHLALESKRTELAYNENQLYPTVDLQGSVKFKGVRGAGQTVTFGGQQITSTFDGTQSDAFGDMAGGKTYDYSVGLSLEYPLFNRGAKSRVAKSMVEVDASQMTVTSLRMAIDLQVLSAARAVETAAQSVKATAVSRELAEKKLAAEMSKYDAGTSTSYLVLQYQNDLAAAKSKEIKAVIDHLKAIARLDLATGATLQNHGVTLAQREQ
ncbi:MAG: TolC family protein [Nitrospinae bacterium]|nr:TolC family protein [Nitrospinota bacterium]